MPGKSLYKKVTIVGLGFMGGSLGLALKDKHLAGEVVGWGRSEEKLEKARKQGAVDRWTMDRDDALSNADLLVFSTPGSVTRRLAPEWFARAPSGCLMTDLLSVKGGLVDTLTGFTGPRRYYVSSHPLCGSERTGASAARPDLFAGRLCLITPVRGTKKPAIGEIQKLWQALGMNVVSLAPASHDRVVAAVSHLPHLSAAALVNRIGDEKLLSYSGTGLLDTTRIAASSPVLWTEIIMENSKEVLGQIDGLLESLALVKKFLQAGDSSRLGAWLRKAGVRRQKLNITTKSTKEKSGKRTVK